MIEENAIYHETRSLNDLEFRVDVMQTSRNNPGMRIACCLLHWHEEMEIHYVTEGELEIFIDQKSYFLKKGDMAIIHGNAIHITYYSQEMQQLIFIFDMKDLSREVATSKCFQPLILQDPMIGKIMEEIQTEFQDKKAGYRLICKGLIFRLIGHLERNYVESQISEKEILQKKKRLERLDIVKQYIGEHFAEPIENKTLAELIHISEHRFNHLFKECMGVSPRRYVNEIRLNEALRLLRTGSYLISEAAERAGFTDYHYFGRLFRQTYGCAPSEVAGKEGLPEMGTIKLRV